MLQIFFFFFFNDTATTEIYTLSLHDALPICRIAGRKQCKAQEDDSDPENQHCKQQCWDRAVSLRDQQPARLREFRAQRQRLRLKQALFIGSRRQLPELALNRLGLGQRVAASQIGGPEIALGPDRLDASRGGTAKEITNLLRLDPILGQNTIEQNELCGSVLDLASHPVEG